ncbi:MAG: radical SAM family heme chaperone HemW [Kosmotogaceae bacterium]
MTDEFEQRTKSDCMKNVYLKERKEIPGIYFHIPFCKRKCDYCDFTTVRYDKAELKEYNDYLLQEIELYDRLLNNIDSKKVTVYFGGGSPSLFPIQYIKEIIGNIKSRSFDPIEVTLESNPWEITDENLENWKKTGITRLSIGVQSVDSDILKNVGRRSPEDTEKRLEKARKIFDNLNMDFILCLPGESLKSVENNIELINKIKPDHISYYWFDKNQNTPLMRKNNNAIIKLPDNNLCEKWHEYILSELNSLNYRRYEISSWSIKGKESLHNLNYWKNGDYIGCGISAGGHINYLRYVNHTGMNKYKAKMDNKQFPHEFSKENSFFEEFIEKIFMGLRLLDGIEITSYLGNNEIRDYLEILFNKNDKLIVLKTDKLKLTKKGFDLSRRVFESIISTKEEMNDVFRS